MERSTKKIVISGYYGFNNSGDEAVLCSILHALREQGEQAGVSIQPLVLSANPAQTREMYGVEAAHRMRPAEVLQAIRGSDGLISGGGSLLQDATSAKTIPYYLAILKLAQWFGKPTFIYSQGVGPVQRRWFYPLIKGTFARCSYVSVRDQESAALLASMGLSRERIAVVPDPVMGMPLPQEQPVLESAADNGRKEEAPGEAYKGSSTSTVGVSLRFWNKDRSDMLHAAEALRKLAAEQPEVHLRFLPFHEPHDTEASRFVMEELRKGGVAESRMTLTQGVTNPQEMLAVTASCDLLIGMRLHSLIYAVSQFVPVIGISYDPKIDHFLARIGMKAAAHTSAFQPERVVEEARKLLSSKSEWIAEKRPHIEQLILKSQEPAQHIATFFRK
ncbi:polysaccharide pyruvyl transferase CsaB [Paenibacillus turpanensis]|uniref:polysaccharide pyruvyl transferase CsaB n=1 Tax=Paenibacillus turpanensis TaxID=2689078 RepID=UPI00140B1EB2